MNKTKPIIKWTGGKYKEFPKFQQYIPGFDRYFEPFFGGGGVFFSLQPTCTSFLNDKSKDLARFYSLLTSDEFKTVLEDYASAWEQAGLLARNVTPALLPLYHSFIGDEVVVEQFSEAVSQIITDYFHHHPSLLTDKIFIVDPDKFLASLTASIVSKGKRLKQIAGKEARYFDDDGQEDHIETGIKSGLYLFIRRLMNLEAKGTLQMDNCKAAANWYFVREFCYASMFRFSTTGGFNIPYGGIAYNKKDFRQKVHNIFSKPVRKLFSTAHFYNLDFEEFFAKAEPRAGDFIFLDPPYDSEFSEYDQQVFDKDDQLRLRNLLFATTARWMLVIKETDFIRSIYTSPKCHFIGFDKTYTYNVRGRNNRQTTHLIIVNYDVSAIDKPKQATGTILTLF